MVDYPHSLLFPTYQRHNLDVTCTYLSKIRGLSNSGNGMLGVGTDGQGLYVTSDVPTGGSLRVLVSYYTIES